MSHKWLALSLCLLALPAMVVFAEGLAWRDFASPKRHGDFDEGWLPAYLAKNAMYAPPANPFWSSSRHVGPIRLSR